MISYHPHEVSMVHDPLCDLGSPKSAKNREILLYRPFFDPIKVRNKKTISNKSFVYQWATTSKKNFSKKVRWESSEGFFPKMDPNFHGPILTPYGLNFKNPFPTKVSPTHELSIPKEKN